MCECPRARAASRGLRSGRVCLKAAPESTKILQVELVTTPRALEINLLQQCGIKFSLCRLDYRTLTAGWFWDDPTLFVLAVTHRGKLYHEIFCYPTDTTRIAWLRVFEAMHVTLAPVFYRDGRLVSCSHTGSTRLCIPEVIPEPGESDCGN